MMDEVIDIELTDDESVFKIRTTDEDAQEVLSMFEEQTKRGNVFTFNTESGAEALKIRKKILKKRLRGVKGITRSFVRQKDGEYVIYVDGVSLKGMLKVPGVDTTRTTTNASTIIRASLFSSRTHIGIITTGIVVGSVAWCSIPILLCTVRSRGITIVV